MPTRCTAPIAGAAALTAAMPLRFARAAEFTYKWSFNVPEPQPLSVHARAAVKQLGDETNGRVDAQPFSNKLSG